MHFCTLTLCIYVKIKSLKKYALTFILLNLDSRIYIISFTFRNFQQIVTESERLSTMEQCHGALISKKNISSTEKVLFLNQMCIALVSFYILFLSYYAEE